MNWEHLILCFNCFGSNGCMSSIHLHYSHYPLMSRFGLLVEWFRSSYSSIFDTFWKILKFFCWAINTLLAPICTQLHALNNGEYTYLPKIMWRSKILMAKKMGFIKNDQFYLVFYHIFWSHEPNFLIQKPLFTKFQRHLFYWFFILLNNFYLKYSNNNHECNS